MRLLAASLLVAFGLGCSASNSKDSDPFHEDDDATAGDGGLDLDGGLNVDASLDGMKTGPLGCSGDLQSVTDEKGVVQRKCPSDQGCFQGECIPACDAAAKSKGNVGCDFLAATPSFYTTIAPPCFAVFLANNWSKPVKISVSRGGTSYDITSFGRIPSGGTDATAWPTVPSTGLPPNQVAVLFMSSDPSSTNAGQPLKCPVSQAVAGGTSVSGSGKGTAFTIKTDAPVSAYDILPYGGARSFLPSAQLLLPTTAWGTNYVAVVPPIQGTGGPQWGQVVASADNTKITINPTQNLPAAGGVPAAAKGVGTSFTLNRGEYVQWQPSLEMSGSIIGSDKPVAFVGGTGYLCLKSTTSPTGGGCDSGHQMIPPISALASEYAPAPYVTRRKDLAQESIMYRIVGMVEGTNLTYEPAVPGAPTTLARGTTVNFEATGPFIVKSQDDKHPFYVAQMMSGCNTTSGSRPGATVSIGFGGQLLGDEEFVNVLPPMQFLTKYVFFTDPTYSTTNLVVTRVKGPSGFKDVKVACAGTLKNWKPIGTSGKYEYTDIDLVRSAMGVGGCTNGPQVAESEGQFGLVVWGTDTYSSYAYPGGGNVGTINTVIVDPVPK